MSYQERCIFNEKVECPLSGLGLKIDGNLCEACADIRTLEGMKSALIAELLVNYQTEEKAKKIYDRIGELVGEW